MKFLVPNYSCLQNSWLGGYRTQIPVLSVLCPQRICWTSSEQNSWVRHCCQGFLWWLDVMVTRRRYNSHFAHIPLFLLLFSHLRTPSKPSPFSVFPTKLHMPFSSLPRVPHASPIIFYDIWLPDSVASHRYTKQNSERIFFSPKSVPCWALTLRVSRHFMAKGHTHYFWAGSRAARGKITLSGKPNCLDYVWMCLVYTQCTNVAVDRGLENRALYDR